MDTDEEAKATAVPLSSSNVPLLEYQDIFDEVRAFLTDDGRFYTVLDETVPAHRALIRYNANGNVAFERVYSWLDTDLLDQTVADVVTEVDLSASTSVIPDALIFDSESFWIEAEVILHNRGDFDRLLQLTITEDDGSTATVDLGLSISDEQPFPYLDVYGESLSDVETANLKGDHAEGGLRYRADVMPVKEGHDDLSDWHSILVGASDSSLGVNDIGDHYGVLFRGNGLIEVWDGNSEIVDDIFYAEEGDYGGTFHRVNVVATGDDGNPFDGNGISLIDVYSSLSPAPIHSYEKGSPGYASNNFRTYGIGDGELKNLRVTRISDGTAFAVATTELPLEDAVVLRFVGNGDQCFIYLNDLVDPIAEGPNLVGVRGALTNIEWGSDLGTDVSVLDSRLSVNDADSNLPRVVNEVVEVGQRLVAPGGESGAESDEDYLAGYINQAEGRDSFSVTAYVDPLDADNEFDTANRGSIIPVNAIPGENTLEVWWMRPNGADTGEGFSTVYWPSVIGHYTIVWPADPPQIVLASNDGSGALDSLPASGEIYYQNDPDLPGYNPNEEHGLMSGGQVFALRDDLNVLEDDSATGANDYSSEPFVLLEYLDEEERPSMIAFEVLRELPGETFDIEIDAGTVIQPPMPLPLLSTTSVTVSAQGVETSSVDDDSKVTLTFNEVPERAPFETFLLQHTGDESPVGFYISDVDYDLNQIEGYVTDGALYELSYLRYEALPGQDSGDVVRTQVLEGVGFPTLADLDGVKALLISDEYEVAVAYDIAQITENRLWVVLPDASATDIDAGALDLPSEFVIVDVSVADEQFNRSDNEWRITSTLEVNEYNDFTRLDRKGNRWVYRGPHDENDGDRFQVQYTYETLEGFYFPGEVQPPAGTVTPYLRLGNFTDGFVESSYLDDDRFILPYPVTYIPQWPDDVPELHLGESLTLSRRGLPAIRGNSSLEVIYDQGMADDVSSVKTAILHDPTREKEYELGVDLLDENGDPIPLEDSTENLTLEEIPASVATTTYNGDVFFDSLPPHLSERFFMDPNRGEQGGLVFKGLFVEETVGEDYLMLNVAGAKDLDALYGLCDTADVDYATWVLAINNLQAVADVFIENPEVPGTYLAASEVQAIKDDEDLGYENPEDETLAQTLDLAIERLDAVDSFYRQDGDPGGIVTGYAAGIGDLVEVMDDDAAVDSYALTATGLGSGYVSLLAGDGLAFTDVDDPVSILVIKVVDTWHQGEVKVILAPNPLAEKVTIQQVVDLAGKARDGDGMDPEAPLYAFDWRLAAPEDGLAPDSFGNQVATLWNDKGWAHLPLPIESETVDDMSGIVLNSSNRTAQIPSGTTSVTVLEDFTGSTPSVSGDDINLTIVNRPVDFVDGNKLTLTDTNDATGVYSVVEDSTTEDIVIAFRHDEELEVSDISSVVESREHNIAQSYLYSEFEALDTYSELWFSLGIDTEKLGVRVYLNGVEVITSGMASIDPVLFTDSTTSTPPDGLDPDFSPVGDTYLVSRDLLSVDETANQLVIALYTTDEAVVGESEYFELKIEAVEYIDIAAESSKWIPMDEDQFLDGVRAIVGDTADVQSLSDQHVIMRYGPANSSYDEDTDSILNAATEWSEWTEPQLVEGWIKRVLAGINPFNQRTTDLFNNAVDTDGSMLTLAGPRWEGDIALNSDTIDDFGLIEIYETVINRGRMLSIDFGINYGPANDALLLATSYINDLYMFVGNEAYADSLNPTIGVGTSSGTFGDLATSLFAFKGQVATLLEEELAMIRGRDDFLPPGVEANPVYNRLFWNYTRGIDSGEVIYASNYNIQEDNNGDFDGIIDAEDAAVMYPQGHGDAYGHYLTALKGYYSLLADTDFEWVPRTESVTILGQTVQVDYTDERKFASAASAVAKAGKQALDLTWRQDYQSGDDVGWEHFGAEAVRSNSERLTTRYWGVDHWASRSGQGSFVNWVAGNAMLPEVDDDPEHEGIQVIDRTTVPELAELADVGRDIQASMDTVDAHLNPLGLSNDSVVFDINPHSGFGTGGTTHFEQVFERAKTALGNAVVAFDDAKDITAGMRSETDSLADFQASVDSEEIAYTNALIDIYGTPYSDDIGVGETYETGYEGPDLVHYLYVDLNEYAGPSVDPYATEGEQFEIDIQALGKDFHTGEKNEKNQFDSFIESAIPHQSDNRIEGEEVITITLDSHGFVSKPDDWTGRRESPGKLQEAISGIIKARNKASHALESHKGLKYELDRMIEVWNAQKGEDGYSSEVFDAKYATSIAEGILDEAKMLQKLYDLWLDSKISKLDVIKADLLDKYPRMQILGFSSSFDPTLTFRGVLDNLINTATETVDKAKFYKNAALVPFETNIKTANRILQFEVIGPAEGKSSRMDRIFAIDMKLRNLQLSMHQINQAMQELADAHAKLQKLEAEGNRLQSEREVFRRRSAALTQGYRTRDAAFRIFRDEKLERYNSLFDLAAQYSFLAAKAFDYETGLLHTDQGQEFLDRIVGSRALGVVSGGEPQFAGSDTGDPGLSSALAEMGAEWQVLRGRLGFNNPDVYGTTVSLRSENFRILPDSDGDFNWRDVLEGARTSNLLEDEDVVRYCMQIDLGDGLPVPGIILEFGTEITPGYNLFGQPLAGGDHAFDVSLFATKIHSLGVILEGYRGMDDPDTNSAVTGEDSTGSPIAAFLDTTLLSATPSVYVIPTGLDVMRSPPLGDESVLRTWSVEDVTIPLPFNLGGSEFSTKKLFTSADSLTEELFSVRKHQAFRPVSDASLFGENPRLFSSIYTNSRLVGRSVWNTRWKLVIPGRSLLNDPEQGLDVLIDALTDIKIHFQTYSYSGN